MNDSAPINPFQVIAERRADDAIALANAFTCVHAFSATPDGVCADNLATILRFHMVMTHARTSLINYLDGNAFFPWLPEHGSDELNNNRRFLRIQELAREYIES